MFKPCTRCRCRLIYIVYRLFHLGANTLSLIFLNDITLIVENERHDMKIHKFRYIIPTYLLMFNILSTYFEAFMNSIQCLQLHIFNYFWTYKSYFQPDFQIFCAFNPESKSSDAAFSSLYLEIQRVTAYDMFTKNIKN